MLLGAPAASAAEDGRPVISLDPPDVGAFLVPHENGDMYGGLDASAAAPDGSTEDPVAVLEQVAPLVPDEVAAALGVDDVVAESHRIEGAVDVEYGGTVVVRLPALVDARDAEFTLELMAADLDDPSYFFESDAALPAHQLTVAQRGANEFAITMPGPVAPYGPEAWLTVDRLTSVDPGVEFVFPVDYLLEFTGPGAGEATLEPTLGIFSHATCSIDTFEPCPGPTVRAGSPVDLVVPPTSLVATLGYGRLDTAIYGLESAGDEGPWESFDSETDPDLVTVHGPSSATLHVPAGARPAPYYGVVVEGDPTGAFAVTTFELEVEAEPEVEDEVDAVPVNAGLHSDTGWVEEVREGSSGSTAAVAGGALLLVGGLVTLVAVRPARRPPLGG